ncbi:MAG: hypothetical protein JSS61_04080 [Verrucomicrobia bacterium]|nr:hypothetical protein [Verrucomicrobiota bacterium]
MKKIWLLLPLALLFYSGHPPDELPYVTFSPTTPIEMGTLPNYFEQPYTFLGSGGQCLAYQSADGNYILKLVRNKPLCYPAWALRIPLVRYFKEKKRKKKIDATLEAFHLCFEKIPTETGLIYVHLIPTSHQELTLVDATGTESTIDLGSLPFALQKKGEIASQQLLSWIQNKERIRAEQGVEAILELMHSLHQKGIRNRDPNFRSNFGFCEGTPFLIDIGRVAPIKKEEEPKRDLDRLRRKMEEWLYRIVAQIPQVNG